ncbi:uncharacterized protein LOC125038732 isoform X2 [Penaeus chinensis]|uniref:uncharacterized protein LOC125038732 isoform X2 n=1 Tax=Penaeus chinensis TaxID=139456 RepID=UPI001FB67BFB|nr:uncharacterized protein LOC125038732 isoform X2 [Penaeus chinensis]
MKAVIISCLFAAALVANAEVEKGPKEMNLVRTKRELNYPAAYETEHSESGGADLIIQVKQMVNGGSSCCCGGSCCGHCCHRNGHDCAENNEETESLPTLVPVP